MYAVSNISSHCYYDFTGTGGLDLYIELSDRDAMQKKADENGLGDIDEVPSDASSVDGVGDSAVLFVNGEDRTLRANFGNLQINVGLAQVTGQDTLQQAISVAEYLATRVGNA